MALIKLYESANPVTLYSGGLITPAFFNMSWYSRRYDCVIFGSQSYGVHKLFRDGTTCRVCKSDGAYMSYDSDLDLLYRHPSGSLTSNYYVDPISLNFDPSRPARFTYTGSLLQQSFIWRDVAYWTSGTSTIFKYALDGTSLGNFSLTGSISYTGTDTWAITDNGIFVGINDSNGTSACVRFYDMATSTNLYTSTFDRSSRTFVDTSNNNIWSINSTTNKMQVYSFDVAPSSFSAITMGSNRARYREDALSVTLSGSSSEPVRNWPVKWTLSTSEGHLKETVSLTGTNGVATNTYCGPGADDYVGGSQTITVETGY